MARKTIEQIDASLARWQTRLKRAVNAIEKLGKQRKRVVSAASRPPKVRPVATDSPPPAASPPAPLPAQPLDTGIPAFLQRRKLDPVAEQIMADQAETKRLKARGRIAKMKAKQSGETKRMPLTGKAALAAIRNA
jgi:hypothetical protein